MNRIDDSMRIVRVGAIESYCVAINKFFHMINIDLVELVEFGLADFDVKVHGTFVDGCVDSIGDDTRYREVYMFGLGFLA